MTSGRTPVAIGSRVPKWPIFFVRAMRRILPTTSWEVQPSGLSTMMAPSKPLLSQKRAKHGFLGADPVADLCRGGAYVTAGTPAAERREAAVVGDEQAQIGRACGGLAGDGDAIARDLFANARKFLQRDGAGRTAAGVE